MSHPFLERLPSHIIHSPSDLKVSNIPKHSQVARHLYGTDHVGYFISAPSLNDLAGRWKLMGLTCLPRMRFRDKAGATVRAGMK